VSYHGIYGLSTANISHQDGMYKQKHKNGLWEVWCHFMLKKIINYLQPAILIWMQITVTHRANHSESGASRGNSNSQKSLARNYFEENHNNNDNMLVFV
jgi:hypothetical protein